MLINNWTIAHRVYADYSEKRKKRRIISFENGELFLAAEENEIDKFIEETATIEQVKRILQEISFLSKAYRNVMVMYYIDGIKIREIARSLKLSETTVKQRLFSARNIVFSLFEFPKGYPLYLMGVYLENSLGFSRQGERSDI